MVLKVQSFTGVEDYLALTVNAYYLYCQFLQIHVTYDQWL
jgi:hypothetical protein